MNFWRKVGKVTILLILLQNVVAGMEEKNVVCAVYFTGIGCPHCAKTDPIVLGSLPLTYNNSLVIIEYEIYQQPENAKIMAEYNSRYSSGLGIPQLIFDEEECILGDLPILENIKKCVEKRLKSGNPCPLLTGSVPFFNLNFNQLPGKPKIWIGNKVVVRKEEKAVSSSILRKILLSDRVDAKSIPGATVVTPEAIPLSGSSVEFNRAIKLNGWMIEWRDKESKTGGEVRKSEAPSTKTKISTHSSPTTQWKSVLILVVVVTLVLLVTSRKGKNRR